MRVFWTQSPRSVAGVLYASAAARVEKYNDFLGEACTITITIAVHREAKTAAGSVLALTEAREMQRDETQSKG